MSGNQDLIDQLRKYAGVEAFSIGFRMMLEKAANIVAAHEKPEQVTRWWDLPSELEHRTLRLLQPIENGAMVAASPHGGVQVSDTKTGYGFTVSREEFIDGIYIQVIPERWTELMRQRVIRAATPYDLDVDPELMRTRKEEGLGAPDKPAT